MEEGWEQVGGGGRGKKEAVKPNLQKGEGEGIQQQTGERKAKQQQRQGKSKADSSQGQLAKTRPASSENSGQDKQIRILQRPQNLGKASEEGNLQKQRKQDVGQDMKDSSKPSGGARPISAPLRQPKPQAEPFSGGRKFSSINLDVILPACLAFFAEFAT